MKHLSRLDIETIAGKYIKAYMELPEVKGTHIYRVDPELFVEKVLGLKIQYEHLSYDGKTLGLTSFEEVAVSVLTEADEEDFVLLDGKTVLIESDLKTDKKWRGRKHFTIMHEGCHQIFKALYPNDYGGSREKAGAVHYYKVNEDKSRRIRDWEEWQANTLCSAIFLPPDLIKQSMYLFELGEKIDCLNKVFRPAVYEKFSAMADFLGSSKKALAIQEPLGKKLMADVTPDDVKLALLPALGMSQSIYRSTQMLYKLIFTSAVESNVITKSPADKIPAKGGKPQKVKEALTDEQVEKLLDAIRGLPPYVFVMIGLYCGLRREEILALQWDCVFLEAPAPYLSVRRAWHTEHNRPVILDELKTKAAKRDIPIPPQLLECLIEAKKNSKSPFVVANRDGEALSYTQFQRVWKYIVTRSNKERTYVRYVNGQRIKHTIKPVLGEKAPHNGTVVYSLDFQVTPHQLRHTYITNLIYAGVDPKTVQYLAGHENSKITLDIYAKVKYNNPEALSTIVNRAFGHREAATA